MSEILERYFIFILLSRVSDPYSFFTDPNPDPEDPDGGQYGSDTDPDPDPIRIRIQSGSRALMTKN
jgi:hypothetical protein